MSLPFLGRVLADGRVYDATGRYVLAIDPDGQLTDQETRALTNMILSVADMVDALKDVMEDCEAAGGQLSEMAMDRVEEVLRSIGAI